MFKICIYICWFSLSRHINKNQNRSIEKVQNLGKARKYAKKKKYAKILAKIQVTTILNKREFREMQRRHAGAGARWAPRQDLHAATGAAGNQQKHLSLSFATKA